MSQIATLALPDDPYFVPVLQTQNGWFVGYVDGGNHFDMVAFDANGSVRWMVPNESPQMATADGGVIGESGITYDQNGNATGQGNLYTQSWTTQSYLATGGQIAASFAPSVKWATSYHAMMGGNPSANGTSVGVAESVDGFAFQIKSWGPSCQWQASGGTKVPLGGAALSQYNSKKQQLLAGNYLTSASCSTFFNTNPTRAAYFTQLPNRRHATATGSV